MKSISFIFCFGLGLAVLTASGCANFRQRSTAVLFPANPDSNYRKGEATSLQLTYELSEEKVEAKRPKLEQIVRDATGESQALEVLASEGVDLALAQIIKALEEEADRYEGSYSAVTVGDRFYQGWYQGEKINLSGFIFERRVKGENDPAMVLKCIVKGTLDGTAFQIIPESIVIRKSKAKLLGWDWLLPWTWYSFSNNALGKMDNDVNVNIEVSLHAVWIDNQLEGHSQLVATGEMKIGNMTLGEEKSLSSQAIAKQLFPGIPRSHIASIQASQGGSRVIDEGDDESLTRESSFTLDTKVLGPGNFILTVLVKEYDEYGERVKETSTLLEENKDEIREGILGRILP